MKHKIKCANCGYEWKTESKLIMVTCPSCQVKTKFEYDIEEEKKGETNVDNKREQEDRAQYN